MTINDQIRERVQSYSFHELLLACLLTGTAKIVSQLPTHVGAVEIQVRDMQRTVQFDLAGLPYLDVRMNSGLVEALRSALIERMAS